MVETPEPRKVVLLPGDGVGPEVIESAAEVLEAVKAPIRFETHAFGGAGIDAHSDPLPEQTLDACRRSDAILLGAVGGPRWDGQKLRPEAGLLRLRKELQLFANLRPVKPILSVAEAASPLRRRALEGVDLIVVRELTGGLYFGQPRERRIEAGEVLAVDTALYRSDEIRRIAQLGFELARRRRGKLTSIDKANVLETSRLWREVVSEVQQSQFSEVSLDHQLVDSAAMRLLTHAASFDILLAGNLFGDILSDEASVLAGSIGLLPSASLSGDGRGLYEPIHGSAPDLAGQGRANPIGTILSAAMMLEHSLGQPSLARRIETAVETALMSGERTPDLGGTLNTREMTRSVISHLGN